MVFWLLKTSFLSILLIVTIHYLYLFFKKNLTQPLVKDLVNNPAKQYNEIYKIVNTGQSNNASDGQGTSSISSLPGSNNMPEQPTYDQPTFEQPKEITSYNESNMQDELSQFLQDDQAEQITGQVSGDYNNFAFGT